MGGWGGDEDYEPSAKELLASANLLRQYDLVARWLSHRANHRPLLWPGFLRRLHAVTCRGIEDTSPGMFRVEDNEILLQHDPPPWQEVPKLVKELCQHVAFRTPAPGLETAQGLPMALELGAYTLWRVNWVHPFNDGNGRVARAAAYCVTAAILGGELPGKLHIHEYINTHGYYEYLDGLDEADNAWAEGEQLDLARLKTLLVNALKAQLESRLEP